MKPRCRLYKIALVFHVFGWSAQANDLFLSDTLVRKGQLQDVLEHQPAKVPSCKNAVVRSFEVASTLIDFTVAHRPDRNHDMRLRDSRECQRQPIRQPFAPCSNAVL